MDWRAHSDSMQVRCWYLARYAYQDFGAMMDLPSSQVRKGCETISKFLEVEFDDKK